MLLFLEDNFQSDISNLVHRPCVCLFRSVATLCLFLGSGVHITQLWFPVYGRMKVDKVQLVNWYVEIFVNIYLTSFPYDK